MYSPREDIAGYCGRMVVLTRSTAIFALFWAALQCAGAATPANADLAIINAVIYATPDAAPIERGSVLVRRGKIVAVGAGASVPVPNGTTVIDAQGGAVVAGFWNSHVHILTPGLLHAADRSDSELSSELQQMFTRWGFTTVFDLASSLVNTQVLRHRIDEGQVMGPRILTVGDPFFPEGGTPIYVKQFLQQNGFPSEEVSSPAEAGARARRQLAKGADGVKIFSGAIVGGKIGVLPMPLDVATAVVREAHRVHKPAFAHPTNLEGMEVAIQSGVDVLAHTTETGPWDEVLVRRLTTRRMALVPTLTLFAEGMRKDGMAAADIDQAMANHTQQIKAFADAGGLILFGTDVGYIDVYDTTEEYRLLSRCLTFHQILASLTTNPAGRFAKGKKVGRVAVGADADIVVLAGDPAHNIEELARVRYTIKGGRVIFTAP
jgi:imidazolonepropionase-like amidohydrolase